MGQSMDDAYAFAVISLSLIFCQLAKFHYISFDFLARTEKRKEKLSSCPFLFLLCGYARLSPSQSLSVPAHKERKRKLLSLQSHFFIFSLPHQVSSYNLLYFIYEIDGAKENIRN